MLARSRAFIPTMTVVLALSLLAATPANAAEKDPLSAEERAWYDGHGPIRYAPDPDYPPFEFLDEHGEPIGINFDFLNRMSRNLDIEFDVRLYDNWTAVLEAMQAGEIDMVGALASTPERATYMDFVGPFMTYGEVFYTNDRHPEFEDVSDLVGHQVAVVENYAASEWLADNHPELDLVYVPNLLTGLERLSAGDVDAFFENVPVAGYYIRERSFNNIRIIGEPAYYSEANWGYTKGVDPLGGIIQKGLDSIPPGEQTRIFEYWTGYDLGIQDPPSASGISPLARGIIGVVAGFLVVAVVWSVTLRQQVRRRTGDLQAKERELVEANATLEERVAARTAELRDLNDNLEFLDSSLASVLRGSATTSDRLIQVIQSQYHGLLKDNVRSAMHRVARDNQRAQGMATSLDLLAHAIAHTPDPTPVDVAHCLQVAARAAAKGNDDVTFTREVSPGMVPVHADPDLLEGALFALIRRVAETVEDGSLHMRLGQEAGPGAVRHELRFRADGLDAEAVRGLQQAFGPGTSERPRAPDLALAAAARVIHRLGGDLELHGAEDGALVFRFTLPPAIMDRPPTPRRRGGGAQHLS